MLTKIVSQATNQEGAALPVRRSEKPEERAIAGMVSPARLWRPSPQRRPPDPDRGGAPRPPGEAPHHEEEGRDAAPARPHAQKPGSEMRDASTARTLRSGLRGSYSRGKLGGERRDALLARAAVVLAQCVLKLAFELARRSQL